MLKHFSDTDIQDLDRVFRLNLMNSITGYKPAALIGTKSPSGQTNLAIFSSVVHLGSNPGLIGFIMRPTTVPRNTYSNICETKYYTINHVHEDFIHQAHYTSAKFESDTSEFEACNLEAEYLNDFWAPYVAESQLKIGLELVETIDIKANGTILVIGKVKDLHISESCIQDNGRLQLEALKTVAISGLNKYNTVSEIAEFPYARVSEVPTFK
jgi:flavin reductase (DIM6/NTAB) family NADH-FMN oxidoreductase RutF